MRRELAERIYLKCPLIFRGRHADPHRNLMYFGFNCGDGWFQIIQDLSLDIEMIAQKQREDGVEDESLPLVSQVKEKYATLRFYVHNTTDVIEELIDNAEAETAVTCERCGKSGKIGGEAYFRVCVMHAALKSKPSHHQLHLSLNEISQDLKSLTKACHQASTS